MIPEIDIWRAAQFMLKRYGDKAAGESAARADELAAAGDEGGAATWRRITNAVGSSRTKHRLGRCTDQGNANPRRDKKPHSTPKRADLPSNLVLISEAAR
jgi:hypothetical protein